MLKNSLKYTTLMMLGLFASDLTATKPTQKTKQSAKSAPLSNSVDIFNNGYSKILALAQDAVNEGKKKPEWVQNEPVQFNLSVYLQAQKVLIESFDKYHENTKGSMARLLKTPQKLSPEALQIVLHITALEKEIGVFEAALKTIRNPNLAQAVTWYKNLRSIILKRLMQEAEPLLQQKASKKPFPLKGNPSTYVRHLPMIVKTKHLIKKIKTEIDPDDKFRPDDYKLLDVVLLVLEFQEEKLADELIKRISDSGVASDDQDTAAEDSGEDEDYGSDSDEGSSDSDPESSDDEEEAADN